MSRKTTLKRGVKVQGKLLCQAVEDKRSLSSDRGAAGEG